MKKKIIILGIAFLIVTLFVMKETYALFETNANGDSDFDIGKWVIKLNKDDITYVKDITFDEFTYTSSVHTEKGYFAPGSTAEFEIDIDVTDTDVSVEYDIDIDDTDIEAYPNIHVKMIDLDTDNEIALENVNGVITLEDANRIKKFKLVLEWENDPDYDESDTSLIGEELIFKAKANFKQYLEG